MQLVDFGCCDGGINVNAAMPTKTRLEGEGASFWQTTGAGADIASFPAQLALSCRLGQLTKLFQCAFVGVPPITYQLNRPMMIFKQCVI